MTSREDQFTRIWIEGSWGSPKSGPYALPRYTEQLKKELPRIIEKYHIASIFDAPCGDFTWMQDVKLGDVKYIGGDIVRPMIRDLQNFYEDKDFRHHDLIRHPMPMSTELWFCRDCLYMLTMNEIAQVFRHAQRAEIKYFMLTSNLNPINVITDPHADRQQNLCASPFDFPEPLEWIDDWYEDRRRPGLKARRMGLWSQDQLADTMSAFIGRFL